MRFYFLFIVVLLLRFSLNAQTVKVKFVEDNKLNSMEKAHDSVLLTWKDFKGVANPNSQWYALTTTFWRYGITGKKLPNGNINITIKSKFYFDKKLSNKKKLELDSAQQVHILQHEQLHFDIAWYWYNQFIDSIKKMNYTSNYINQTKLAYNYYQQSAKDMQSAYDEVTNHSINKEEQLLWYHKIKQLYLDYGKLVWITPE